MILKIETILPVKNDIKIISLGNASTNNSQAGKIYSTEGLFPTVCACTHGYAIGYILEEDKTKDK